MRPGGIQDESSKHEHPKVPKLLRFLSQAKFFVYYHGTKRLTPRQLCQSPIKRRRMLHKLSGIIYSHTAWMGEVLLAAERSQLIDPAFVKKAAAVKDDLEMAAAAPTMDNVSGYVHAARLKRAMVQLVNARRTFAYLCKVLDVERAEL